MKRWSIFGICVSLFLMSMFYRVSGAIIAPDLISELKLNAQDLGLVGAVFFYSFALIQPALGLSLDRFGARLTMIVLNFIGVAGALTFAHTGGLWEGIVGRALLGLGMAANLMGTLKLFTKWFDPSKFASLTGLVISIGAFGSLAATSPLALLVQALGWRVSFVVLAGLNAFLTACVWFFVSDSPLGSGVSINGSSNETVAPIGMAGLKALFTNWNYWAISLSTFLRYGSFASIQALWIGPFLIEYLGLPAVNAGNLLLMLNIGWILGSWSGGLLSDRLIKSRKWTLITGISLTAIAVFALAQWQSRSLLFLLGAVLFCIAFFSSFGQVSYAHIRELMPKEISGTAMTGLNFFLMMGAGVFIHGLGYVMEHMNLDLSESGEGYRVAFMICFWALVIALTLYFTTRDTVAPPKSEKPYNTELCK